MIENKQSKTSSSRNLLGILLVLIGGIVLLNNLDLIDFSITHVVFSGPMILIVLGIIFLINSRNKFVGTLLLIMGIIFLVPRIFPWIHFNFSIVFPIIIIALGLYVLFRRNRYSSDSSDWLHRKKGEKIEMDILNEVAVFGGGEKIINSDNFKGGNITAIFGGSEIDLSGCKLAPGQNIIDIIAIFGGTTLVVPKEWNVHVDVLPIFGGFSTKGKRFPTPETEMDRTLIIKGTVIFGGGEIKSY